MCIETCGTQGETDPLQCMPCCAVCSQGGLTHCRKEELPPGNASTSVVSSTGVEEEKLLLLWREP